jgi:hypothetical protein
MVCCVIAQLVKVIKGIETKIRKERIQKFAIYNLLGPMHQIEYISTKEFWLNYLVWELPLFYNSHVFKQHTLIKLHFVSTNNDRIVLTIYPMIT